MEDKLFKIVRREERLRTYFVHGKDKDEACRELEDDVYGEVYLYTEESNMDLVDSVIVVVEEVTQEDSDA